MVILLKERKVTILFFIKKNYKHFLIIFILLILLAYVSNITFIPNSLILFENEELNIKSIWGIKLEETVEVGAELVSTTEDKIEGATEKEIHSSKSKSYSLSFLGFNLKTIKANIVPSTKVIPVGSLVGLKLYTNGVLVVGMSEVKGQDNKIYKPYEKTGIEQGDAIVEINDETVTSTEEMIACVSKCRGKSIEITYIKDGKTLETTITPVKTSENTYKLGLWVRDLEAGIGTVTFYDSNSNSFAALGHGIQDVDTGELVKISSGKFVSATILDIEKGQKESPGKIEGTIDNGKEIGNIYSNTDFGVYGTTTNKEELEISNMQEIEVASRSEIETGKACIICTLEEGIRKEYEIEIQKIYINNNENNKSMVVKVTDEELLEKTGGIIQGMSGSPVIQNGKLIGALTHVLVSDPTRGYAVFADTMVSQLK